MVENATTMNTFYYQFLWWGLRRNAVCQEGGSATRDLVPHVGIKGYCEIQKNTTSINARNDVMAYQDVTKGSPYRPPIDGVISKDDAGCTGSKYDSFTQLEMYLADEPS